ncbi:MAG: hypothetical protein OXE59_12740 [Bacteroidetes bacterium]|nr:hypothetical protein [Bacteroidota bacterium]
MKNLLSLLLSYPAFIYALMLIALSLSACDSATGPTSQQVDPVEPNISDAYVTVYGGKINYTHENTVKASATVGVKASKIPAEQRLVISDDLTIGVGGAGAFTLALNQAPEAPLIVAVAVHGKHFDIGSVYRIDFTPNDWGPKVLTVTHTGDQAGEAIASFGLEDVVETRMIQAVEGKTIPQVFMTGDVTLAPGGSGLIIIAVDQNPGAEEIFLDLEQVGEWDAYTLSAPQIHSFKHWDWQPRTVHVTHTGADTSRVSVKIAARGNASNSITVMLSQDGDQSKIKGSERVGQYVHEFVASGEVSANGLFTPQEDLLLPFAVSCIITATKESRIRFSDSDVKITQSFNTRDCPSLHTETTIRKRGRFKINE